MICRVLLMWGSIFVLRSLTIKRLITPLVRNLYRKCLNLASVICCYWWGIFQKSVLFVWPCRVKHYSANSVEPDEILHYTPSLHGLWYLPFCFGFHLKPLFRTNGPVHIRVAHVCLTPVNLGNILWTISYHRRNDPWTIHCFNVVSQPEIPPAAPWYPWYDDMSY